MHENMTRQLRMLRQKHNRLSLRVRGVMSQNKDRDERIRTVMRNQDKLALTIAVLLVGYITTIILIL